MLSEAKNLENLSPSKYRIQNVFYFNRLKK